MAGNTRKSKLIKCLKGLCYICSVISFILVIGSIGAIEQNLVPLGEGIWRSIYFLTMFALFTVGVRSL